VRAPETSEVTQQMEPVPAPVQSAALMQEMPVEPELEPELELVPKLEPLEELEEPVLEELELEELELLELEEAPLGRAHLPRRRGEASASTASHLSPAPAQGTVALHHVAGSAQTVTEPLELYHWMGTSPPLQLASAWQSPPCKTTGSSPMSIEHIAEVQNERPGPTKTQLVPLGQSEGGSRKELNPVQAAAPMQNPVPSHTWPAGHALGAVLVGASHDDPSGDEVRRAPVGPTQYCCIWHVCPAGQSADFAHGQMAPSQAAPPEHAVPHAPQLLESVCRSVHDVPQSVVPVAQAQLPPWHV
jgi:hypothetical protein